MEDTTPSYEQLYMNHQRVLAEYYRDSVDFHKQIIQLKDELAEAKLALQKAQHVELTNPS
jgi:hypothetical protein